MAAGALVNRTLIKKTLAVQQLMQKTSEMLNGLTRRRRGRHAGDL